MKRTREFFQCPFHDIVKFGSDDTLVQSMSTSMTGYWRQEPPQGEQKTVKKASVQQRGK